MTLLKKLALLLSVLIVYLMLSYIDFLLGIDPANGYVVFANLLLALAAVFLAYVIRSIIYRR